MMRVEKFGCIAALVKITKGDTRAMRAHVMGVIGLLMITDLMTGVVRADNSSATQSAVPSDGGSVKSGDVIIWKVNKSINREVPAPNAMTQTSTTPTLADTAAAAATIQTVANKLAVKAPAGAGASEVSKYQAAEAAADKASAAWQDAASQAYAETTKSTASVDGTRGALEKYLGSAVSGAQQARAAAQPLASKAAADLQSATDAARPTAKGTATAADKAAADAAQKQAADSTSQSLKADVALATAEAYLTAVTNALAAAPTIASASIASAASSDTRVCFPRDSMFQVTNVVAASTTSAPKSSAPAKAPSSDNSGSSTVTSTSNTQLVSGSFSSQSGWKSFHFMHPHALPYLSPKSGQANVPQNDSFCGQGYKTALYDMTYDFTSDQLSKQDFVRGGFTWGALVIPYKFYFADRSIKSNSSTVAFAGYEGWFPGVSLSGVLALGPGLTSAAASNQPSSPSTASPSTASTSKTVSAATYTFAGGLIAAFGDSKTVKAGLLFGFDYVASGANFQYQGKGWLALSIGAGF